MKIGILFDLDGTLLNTLEDLTDAVNFALRQSGCPERSQREIRSFLGNGVRHLIGSALPETDAPPLEQVLEVYQEYYADHNQDKTAPYPGVLQALEQLKKRYPVAIVSNKHHSAVETICAHYFGSNIYARGETADCPRKPAPDMLFRAMEALGVDRCIYVGDSEVDLLAAKNAGVPCLTVSWGFRDRPELEQAGAEEICDQPEAMAAALDRMAESLFRQ